MAEDNRRFEHHRVIAPPIDLEICTARKGCPDLDDDFARTGRWDGDTFHPQVLAPVQYRRQHRLGHTLFSHFRVPEAMGIMDGRPSQGLCI